MSHIYMHVSLKYFRNKIQIVQQALSEKFHFSMNI